MVNISAEAAEELASQWIGNKEDAQSKWHRRQRGAFNVPCDVIRELWDYIEQTPRFRRGSGFQPKHLFWTLNYMKTYPTWEEMHRTVPGHPSEDTCTTWVWEGLKLLSELDLIDWNERFTNQNGSICLVTVDGIDFRIQEQTPFDPELCSHKFNGPGLRYEMGICIQTGLIVWVNGPFKAGFPDRNIAREELNDWLLPGEMYLADGGYTDGNQYCVAPVGDRRGEYEHMKTVARARHETINGLFKRFRCLTDVFRNKPDIFEKHFIVTMAVINVVQAAILAGYTTFDVEYDDRHEDI